MKPQEGAQLCSSGVKGEGRSGSARPSHGAASGPVGGGARRLRVWSQFVTSDCSSDRAAFWGCNFRFAHPESARTPGPSIPTC